VLEWHGAITSDAEFAACREGKPPAPASIRPCIYLAEQLNNKVGDHLTYSCRLLNRCTLESNNVGVAACADCKDRLTLDGPDLAEKFLDPLLAAVCR